MDTSVIKNNNKTDGSNKRKALKIAVAVLCVLSVLIIAFLACKNTFFFHLAQKNTLENKYRIAASYASESTSSQAKILSEYIDLRVSINENYPNMLAEPDREILEGWYASACHISEESDGIDKEIMENANGIKQALETIFDRLDAYEMLRPTVLSVMDVFNEINRLYTKDVDGKNTAFTVNGEYERIAIWEQQNEQLIDFLLLTPNGESVYLFNFLVKEIEGECADLKITFGTVLESGYTADDLVRFKGTAQKTFPDIQNGNVSLNVLEKETYEEYLYKGLSRSLIENLLAYFQ